MCWDAQASTYFWPCRVDVNVKSCSQTDVFRAVISKLRSAFGPRGRDKDAAAGRIKEEKQYVNIPEPQTEGPELLSDRSLRENASETRLRHDKHQLLPVETPP